MTRIAHLLITYLNSKLSVLPSMHSVMNICSEFVHTHIIILKGYLLYRCIIFARLSFLKHVRKNQKVSQTQKK